MTTIGTSHNEIDDYCYVCDAYGLVTPATTTRRTSHIGSRVDTQAEDDYPMCAECAAQLDAYGPDGLPEG